MIAFLCPSGYPVASCNLKDLGLWGFGFKGIGLWPAKPKMVSTLGLRGLRDIQPLPMENRRPPYPTEPSVTFNAGSRGGVRLDPFSRRTSTTSSTCTWTLSSTPELWTILWCWRRRVGTTRPAGEEMDVRIFWRVPFLGWL